MIDFNMDVGVRPEPRGPSVGGTAGTRQDPLLDVLRAVRLDGAAFYAADANGRWSLETPETGRLASRILPRARHLISCHIVLEGRCFGGLLGETPVELAAGDVILFPHGDAHLLSSGADIRRGPAIDADGRLPIGETVTLGDGGSGRSTILSGFLGWDLRPGNPLFVGLPRLMHARGMATTWLGHMTRQTMEESRLGRPGADGVLSRLGELLFIEMVRRYLEEIPAADTGWYAGLKDPMVGRALALLHAHPGHPWTLADLARKVSSSRSRLADRFTALIGQPPMHYLTQWRMQVAANLLLESGAKVATVGSEVAYDSEAAFSRAFKRATGETPGAWRETRRRKQA